LTTAFEYSGGLRSFLEAYEFQPELTERLDAAAGQSIDQVRLDEIVLWKLNRYVLLTEDGRAAIDAATKIQPGQHLLGEDALRALLGLHGADLPMASTILRFANPRTFQIIDRHAYRAVYGVRYPLSSASTANRKVDTYFKYLDKLHELCKLRQLDFTSIDRLLYIFDRDVNGSLTE
jgi:hypothetical protein